MPGRARRRPARVSRRPAMETKIDELTDMIQKLVPKDANTAAPGAPATDEASQEPQDLE